MIEAQGEMTIIAPTLELLKDFIYLYQFHRGENAIDGKIELNVYDGWINDAEHQGEQVSVTLGCRVTSYIDTQNAIKASVERTYEEKRTESSDIEHLRRIMSGYPITITFDYVEIEQLTLTMETGLINVNWKMPGDYTTNKTDVKSMDYTVRNLVKYGFCEPGDKIDSEWILSHWHQYESAFTNNLILQEIKDPEILKRLVGSVDGIYRQLADIIAIMVTERVVDYDVNGNFVGIREVDPAHSIMNYYGHGGVHTL